jgi:CO/xanthine dehydrogenase FAD-binding subunit
VRGEVLGPEVVERFGALCAAVTAPIDDHRSSADYRRRAVAVCASRALARVLPPATPP